MGRGSLLIFTCVFFILLIGVIFSVSKISGDVEDRNIEEGGKNQTVQKTCVHDLDCQDSDACIINSCRDGFCAETNVILCYQNDGCCPQGCTEQNDNDC